MVLPLRDAHDEALDELGVGLVQRASLLTRLVFRHAQPGMSRSEGSVLATLRDGPQRITALAELEGLAQPTVTKLVNRLADLGWVARERATEDGRVVLVSLTPAGHDALGVLRERYRPLLRAGLAQLSDEQLAALVDATGALAALIDVLQKEGVA
jgi:DNA-binding MarR family transcriptional regulator